MGRGHHEAQESPNKWAAFWPREREDLPNSGQGSAVGLQALDPHSGPRMRDFGSDGFRPGVPGWPAGLLAGVRKAAATGLGDPECLEQLAPRSRGLTDPKP